MVELVISEELNFHINISMCRLTYHSRPRPRSLRSRCPNRRRKRPVYNVCCCMWID